VFEANLEKRLQDRLLQGYEARRDILAGKAVSPRVSRMQLDSLEGEERELSWVKLAS
jgi:hypothetical protein